MVGRQEGSTLRAHFVEHDGDVFHDRLERPDIVWCPPLGTAHPATIRNDQPTRPRKPPQEPRHGRVVPVELDVRDPAGHVDEVGLALTEDLIRKRRLAAPDELRLGTIHA